MPWGLCTNYHSRYSRDSKVIAIWARLLQVHGKRIMIIMYIAVQTVECKPLNSRL